MAKENNGISDIVKKCKILLLDIEGTTTSISFVKDKLFPYAEENVKCFLESNWESEDVKDAVAALRKQAAEDQAQSVEGFVAVPGEDATRDEQVEGLVNNFKWMMLADRKVGPLKQLQGLIWQRGYDNGDIKGHVYDDVSPALELWRSTEGQKVYIYSSGSVQAQKLLFSKSLAGDLLPLIEGHFDTAVGAKQEAASYAAIVEKIGCKPEEILFLTDIVKEAEAARASGLQAALVSREGNAPLPSEAAALFPVIHSFEQLTLTNKRKPDPQVEEVPAKIPKTDDQDDVKTTSETEVETNGSANADTMETVSVEKAPEQETMEVEETPDIAVAVSETKANIATAEVADITEKDVPMDEVVADGTPAAETSAPIEISKPVIPEIKIDTVDDAAIETSTTEPMDVKALENNAKENSVEAKADVPQMAEPKEDKSMVKTDDTKVKMVDAATLTDVSNNTLKATVAALIAGETKTVDAATETVTIEEAEKLNSESPMAEPKAEIPDSKAIAEPTSVEASAIDDTPVTESKDEADALPSSVGTVEASLTVDVDSDKMAAVTADSSTEENSTAGLKTEEPETFEASLKEANTDAKAAETSTDLSVTADAPMDEALAAVETDTPQNGVVEAKDKSQKIGEIIVEEVIDPKDVSEAPVLEAEPVVEEIGEKTEEIETEKMQTEATESVEKVETVEPKQPAEKTQENVVEEAILSSIEVKDITDDKESLSEVADVIDDVVPIVEEPSHLEEMEELQNAGDVLEKECDEILSKVQNVTNLDYIPVKPLHTITEEMETENLDSNDFVERILDTEMELSMKPEDIDLNTVQEVDVSKTDTDERIGKIEPGTEMPSEKVKVEVTEEQMEVSCDAEVGAMKPEIDNTGAKEATVEPPVEQMDTEAAEPESQIKSEKKTEVPEIAKPQESKSDTEVPIAEPPAEIDVKSETKESEKAPVAVAKESNETTGSEDLKIDDAAETKVNGKSNGKEVVKLNGNTSNVEDLKARLTAETVKEKVNGSNGDSADAENSQGDNKVEEIPDIKVKTVGTDEAHTPIEQPVEA